MGKLNTKKSKKNVHLSKRRSAKGGGTIATAMEISLDQKCDFDTEYNKKTAGILGWRKKNLLKRSGESDFTKLENQKFMKIFNRNLEIFCNKNQNAKYIKFCINFLICANKPDKIYDLLYQMYIFSGTSTEVSQDKTDKKDKNDSCAPGEERKYKLNSRQRENYRRKKREIGSLYSSRGLDAYNGKEEDKITSENYCIDQFVKDYEETNIKNVAKFFINVIKKSIIMYEKTKKPAPDEPSEIIMKDKLEKSLTNIFGSKFEFEKITQDSLEELFKNKKKNIENYTDARVMETSSEELVDDDKSVKKSPFYMYVVFGAFITAIILESGFMAAPPGLEGGMS